MSATLPAPAVAPRYRFFTPTYAGRNVRLRLSVSVVPEIDADEPDAFNVHCEFCCVAVPPGVMVSTGTAPESVSSTSALLARWYVIAHEFTVEVDVPTSIVTLEKSAAPISSVNVEVKVWTKPLVDADVTETAATLKATVQAPRATAAALPSPAVALR